MPFQCRGSSYQNDQRLGSIQERTGEKLSSKILPDEERTRTGVSSYPSVERRTKVRLPWEWSSLENLERINTFCLRLTTLLKKKNTLLGNRHDQDEWMQYEHDYEFKYAWCMYECMLCYVYADKTDTRQNWWRSDYPDMVGYSTNHLEILL